MLNQYKEIMDYIKDQEVNTYNAEIVEEFNTPEKRNEIAERVANTLFKVTSNVEFYGLKEFNHQGDLPPSIYWTYVFRVKGMNAFQFQTITLGNDGGMDFNFHRLGIKSFTQNTEIKPTIQYCGKVLHYVKTTDERQYNYIDLMQEDIDAARAIGLEAAYIHKGTLHHFYKEREASL